MVQTQPPKDPIRAPRGATLTHAFVQGGVGALPAAVAAHLDDACGTADRLPVALIATQSAVAVGDMRWRPTRGSARMYVVSPMP